MSDLLREHFRSVESCEVPDSVLRGDFRVAAARRARIPAIGVAMGLVIALLMGYLHAPTDMVSPTLAAQELTQRVVSRDLPGIKADQL